MIYHLPDTVSYLLRELTTGYLIDLFFAAFLLRRKMKKFCHRFAGKDSPCALSFPRVALVGFSG